MPNRVDQLNSLIHQYINEIIARDLDLPPDFLITITKVEASKDVKYARVYISILPDSKRGTVLKKLNSFIPHLQRELAKKMATKFSPKLRFLIDENEIYASEMDKILDAIKES